MLTPLSFLMILNILPKYSQPPHQGASRHLRRHGFDPWVGKNPWRRKRQYSCLVNPMDRRAWWATVHGVSKSRTQLTDWKTTDRLLSSSPGDSMYSRAGNHSLKWGMNQLLLWSIFLFSCGTLEDWNNFRIQWSSSPLAESEGKQPKRGERVMQEESRNPLNHRKKAFASLSEDSALILT